MVARSLLVQAALALTLVPATPPASGQSLGTQPLAGAARTAAPSLFGVGVPTDPATGLNFVPDPHQGGGAPALKIVRVAWGRLVDVYDQGAGGVRRLRYARFLIGPAIQSNGVDYLLEKSPITQQETLTILHPLNSPGFEQALANAESSTLTVMDMGLGGLPPWAMVARNGALSIRLNDLLDPATVDQDTVKLLTGYPPAMPFELIVRPDPSHGAVRGGTFWSTRVLLDLTVSPFEAQQNGLQVNLLGLPPALMPAKPNALLRLPTVVSPPAAQFEILRNLTGNGLSFTGNGSNDPSSPTKDIVRAFRSGGPTGITGDPYEGFLPDDEGPYVRGRMSITVTFVGRPPGVEADVKTLDFTFFNTTCASQPLPGDVVQLPNHAVQVIQAAAPPVGGSVQNVRVSVILGNPATLQPAPGVFLTTWDAAELAPPACFVDFTPQVAPGPVVGVDADVGVQFSEPMRASSISGFDSFAVEYGVNPTGLNNNPIYRRVVGSVVPALGMQRFTFQPALPLRNVQPPEPYTFRLDGGPGEVVDLVGNPLAYPLPPIPFSIDPSEPAVDSLSVSLNFSSDDEDANGAPELRGQFVPDLQQGVIRSRPVSRFSAQADPSHITVGAMVPYAPGVQTPLSNLGSKLMAAWRYDHLGFSLLDEASHNLDVEGLWWEPSGGAVAPETFSQFQMSVGNSNFLPDEALNTGLLPSAPASGLANVYGANYLGSGALVHPKAQGYAIDPLDLAVTPNGRVVAPWPMNRKVPPAQYKYWTWRDTGAQAVGAPNGFGADTKRAAQLTIGAMQSFYPANAVPTIGLPLLMEFRTYPDAVALGANKLSVALAINTSARPFFRTFSTGGVLTGGTPKLVDPDLEPSGTGGVNPVTGTSTAPQDNVFYYGQADFVVRVSRLHTIWFDALGPTQQAFSVSEPPAMGLPPGTQVVLAYRGATDITSAIAGTWEDARNLDPYGDGYTASQHNKLGQNASLAFATTFLNGDATWKASPTQLAGARYFQVRVSMIADPLTGLTPELSGLGLAFLR